MFRAEEANSHAQIRKRLRPRAGPARQPFLRSTQAAVTEGFDATERQAGRPSKNCVITPPQGIEVPRSHCLLLIRVFVLSALAQSELAPLVTRKSLRRDSHTESRRAD